MSDHLPPQQQLELLDTLLHSSRQFPDASASTSGAQLISSQGTATGTVIDQHQLNATYQPVGVSPVMKLQ